MPYWWIPLPINPHPTDVRNKIRTIAAGKPVKLIENDIFVEHDGLAWALVHHDGSADVSMFDDVRDTTREPVNLREP
jgi:hypothetical protein